MCCKLAGVFEAVSDCVEREIPIAGSISRGTCSSTSIGTGSKAAPIERQVSLLPGTVSVLILYRKFRAAVLLLWPLRRRLHPPRRVSGCSRRRLEMGAVRRRRMWRRLCRPRRGDFSPPLGLQVCWFPSAVPVRACGHCTRWWLISVWAIGHAPTHRRPYCCLYVL